MLDLDFLSAYACSGAEAIIVECANYGNHDSRELRCQSAQLDLLKIFCSLVSIAAY